VAIPSLSAAEAVDFKPVPVDSIFIVAKKNPGAPGGNMDL
jgi:hypothetical protein